MQPRDLFGVVVRAIGFILAVYGLCDYAFLGFIGAEFDDEYSPKVALLAAGFLPPTGIVLIAAAEGIVRFAYGPRAA